MAERTLKVEIIGDASSLNRALGQAQTKTSKFGAVAKTALIGGAAAGMYALGKAAKIGWDEWNQGQRVAAQTAAAIKSTGGVAGITAKHVDSLAGSMLKLTGIDDEATASAENQLLTFTKIGATGGIFDRATQATADLATRLSGGVIPSFEQMNSTAIMVGKGLNNPITGLTRLQRVGVEFTDQQKKQITALAESGKTMAAQKIILKSLEQQYGGSAKAAGETFGGQLTIARERLNNFLGDLVGKAIPYLQRLTAWIRENWPQVREVFVNTLDTIRQAWARWGDEIMAVVRFVFKVVLPIVREQLHIIAAIFRTIGALMRGDWSAAWNGIKSIVRNALGMIRAIITGWFTVAKTLGSRIGGALKDGILAGLRGLANLVKDAVRAALNAAIDALNALASFTVHVPGILPGPSSYTIDFPDIPHVATGGYVARSGAAVIHRGETVVPAMASTGGRRVVLLEADNEIIDYLRGLDQRARRRNGRGAL